MVSNYSARCVVRWGAAVFVVPDEAVTDDHLLSRPFRRLRLQIGGANIAAARIALLGSAYFVLARGR
jgi:hypothetical protein